MTDQRLRRNYRHTLICQITTMLSVEHSEEKPAETGENEKEGKAKQKKH